MREEFLIQNQHLDSIDIESRIHVLRSKLETNLSEELEINESGFSFSSSLKDISKYIVINLLEQLSQDVELTIYIIDNWERFVSALDNPVLVEEDEEFVFNTFTIVYYEAIEYFKRQFLSHLAEKVEFETEYIQDPMVQNFVKQTGFRQRKFSYSIEASGAFSIQQVTASTIKSFEIRKNEREKIEMLNSILLRGILRPEEFETLVVNIVQKFPELEIELINLLTLQRNIHLMPGDSIVEISPPFENYSYQKDCMVRVYTFSGTGFNITQYSIPFVEGETQIVTRNLLSSFGCNTLITSTANIFQSNNILGTLYINNATNPLEIVNSFPSIVDYGGISVVDSASDFISPKINMIGDIIHPFIVESINTPSFFQDQTLFKQSIKKYSEVFLSAIATVDINIRNDNPEVEDLLESGELLAAAVSGMSTSDALSNASSGAIESLEVSSDGYCDTLSGTVGAISEDVQESFSSEEVKGMRFNGKVTNLSSESGFNLDLMKFTDKGGRELKLFMCPVCARNGVTNYIDICAESCSRCKVSLTDLRIASERKGLKDFVNGYPSESGGDYDSGNGIFGVLFDLFGAVVSIFK